MGQEKRPTLYVALLPLYRTLGLLEALCHLLAKGIKIRPGHRQSQSYDWGINRHHLEKTGLYGMS